MYWICLREEAIVQTAGGGMDALIYYARWKSPWEGWNGVAYNVDVLIDTTFFYKRCQRCIEGICIL